MKNLIITIGAVILILTVTQFQIQFSGMVRQKKMMKYVSEEAAASAALHYDAEAFGEGYLKFDREAGENKAEEMIRLNTTDKDNFTWEITFDYKDADNPSVTVSIKKGTARVMSVYEYIGC